MNETMSSVLKDIYKKYDLRVGSLSSVAEDTQVLSTGNLAIDYITGVGGLPLGRSVELYGLSGSGKSTLALQTAASLQQRIIAENRDEFIVYADYEHALDRVYAVALGLDVDHESFLLMQPDTFEQGVSAVLLLLATNKVRLSIWDSVAAMIPDAAIEDTDSKDGFMDRPMDSARKAKLMSGFLRLLNPRLHRFSCTAIFLNHLMDVIDTTPGFKAFKRTTTPGGRALKFYASMRIEFTQIGTVKGKVFDALANAEVEKVETTAVKAKVTKNKVGSPFRECDIKVRLGKGFDNFWSAIQVLIAYKAIEMTKGGIYYFDVESGAPSHDAMPLSARGRPTLHGEQAILDFSNIHKDWREATIKFAQSLLPEADSLNVLQEDVAELFGQSAPATSLGEEDSEPPEDSTDTGKGSSGESLGMGNGLDTWSF